MYDNWIHKLSESYIEKRLGINEEEDHMVIRKPKHPWKPDPDSKPPDLSKFHPKVVTAVGHLNKIMSQHGDHGMYDMDPHINHSNFLVRTSRGLSENPTNSEVAHAAVEAAKDHYGWDINRQLDSDGTYRTGSRGFTDKHLEDLLKDKVGYHLDQHHPEEDESKPKSTNESTNLFEQLNDAKEYAYLLESILNNLLENEVITEEELTELFKGLGGKLAAGAVGLAAAAGGGCGNNNAPCPTPQQKTHIGVGAEGQRDLLGKPKAKPTAKPKAKPQIPGAGAEGEL